MQKKGDAILGIFSRIFSKNTESNSHIRKWVSTEIETVDTSNPDVYGLFVGLLHASVQWGKHGMEEQAAKHYLGDATIFEITCYTYYRLENWLVKNHPEHKNEITLPISKWIIEKFYTTLYVDEQRVSQLFKEQLDRYTNMGGAGKSLEEFHFELEQRILLTKGDKFDKKDRPQDSKNISLDSQYIKESIAIYEESHISSYINRIQDYCSAIIKKQVKAEQSQEQQDEQRDFLFGMALLAQNDSVRACKAFTKVLSSTPDHYDALVQRGSLYLTLHQPVDALEDFTMAIKVNPNNPVAYLHRANCYHRKFKRREKSLADYSKAIELAPKNETGYFGRGELYDEMALHDEKQALEKEDHEKYAHISEEFLAAIHDYSQTIALQPKHDAAYLNRALAYARKARANKNVDFIRKSIADFEQAITLNWENGYLYKQKDEMEELLESLADCTA